MSDHINKKAMYIIINRLHPFHMYINQNFEIMLLISKGTIKDSEERMALHPQMEMMYGTFHLVALPSMVS